MNGDFFIDELDEDGKSCWFVVATQPRREVLARTNLERQGYRVLCPSLTIRKRSRGKWRSVVEPMFPGYLFVLLMLGEDDPAPIRSTLGCIGLVRFGSDPKPIPSGVMLPFLRLGNEPAEVIDPFKPGDKVRFEDGPFEGLNAIYRLSKGKARVEVLLSILGRQNVVTANLSELSRLDLS